MSRDVRRGYYTEEQARERFRVRLSPETGEVDLAATAALREAGSAARVAPGEAGPAATAALRGPAENEGNRLEDDTDAKVEIAR